MIEVIQKTNNNFKVAAFSSANNTTKRVNAAFLRDFKFPILDQRNDLEGRICLCERHFIWPPQKKFLFLHMPPNTYYYSFFVSLSKILAGISDFHVVLGGDMNTTVNPTMDTSNKSATAPLATIAQQNMVSDFSLVDKQYGECKIHN